MPRIHLKGDWRGSMVGWRPALRQAVRKLGSAVAAGFGSGLTGAAVDALHPRDRRSRTARWRMVTTVELGAVGRGAVTVPLAPAR